VLRIARLSFCKKQMYMRYKIDSVIEKQVTVNDTMNIKKVFPMVLFNTQMRKLYKDTGIF